ncbi:MAG: hypothetical protein KJ930_12145 [Gammaproteobacteria bacterium]|nr:hypothetical protein [Gammaproteobacteria bacterium]MBU2180170.1 hypothetical protein [Gammaproteobacteria bacterium]MBU2223957.1 hypothetical protein [Gammaproteobacteria bacterium]MBU2279613.1 hypothetical protein [Gammaproteobacteria bacterium]MBU2427756.1 hypothetical protein [Gammaproteobacteria bacterium]
MSEEMLRNTAESQPDRHPATGSTNDASNPGSKPQDLHPTSNNDHGDPNNVDAKINESSEHPCTETNKSTKPIKKPTGLEFKEGEFNGAQFGNHNTQTNVFLDEPFEDTSTEKSFPMARNVYSHLCPETLENTRKFLAHHAWLVILRNESNAAFQFDMVSYLLQPESGRRYRTQDKIVRCRDYIEHQQKLRYDVPTLTKVFVKNRDHFIEFFKEAENATELSDSLRKSNNLLVFIVDTDETTDVGSFLNKYLGTDRFRYACWCPVPQIAEQESPLQINTLSPVEKAAMVIAAWFNAMPYPLFHSVLHALADTKVKQLKLSDDHSEIPEWWREWQLQPDNVLTNIALENSQLSDLGLYSIRCSSPGDQLRYRQQVQSLARFELTQLWPILKQHLFLPSQIKIAPSLWQDYLVSELATFLEQLHVTGLLTVDTEYLESFYQDVRLANTGDSQSFFRFATLLKHLYRKPGCRDIVKTFIEYHQRHVRKQESALQQEIKQHRDAMESFKRLPHLMPELAALAEKSSDELAYRVYLLKDRAYASWFLLEEVFSANDPAFLSHFVYFVNQHTQKMTLDDRPLISYSIYVNSLIRLFTTNPDSFIAVFAHVNRFDFAENLEVLIEICRYTLLSQLDSRAHLVGNTLNLNILYEWLSLPRGIETCLALLYPDTEHYQDFTEELFYSLIRIKKLLILQKDANPHFDNLLNSLLQRSARALPREDYLRLKELCFNLLDQSRMRLINNTDKKLKPSILAQKDACLFVKQAFKKNGEQNHG